jgi:TolA-binding protein
MDTMGEDFRNLRETVNDVSARLGKLDAKVTDLQNTMSVMSKPPVAPPPTPDAAGTTGAPTSPTTGGTPTPANTGPATPPPGLKAATLYSNGYRDYLGGNYDVALAEFNDYIKYFNDTEFAPNSQFYIGNIYYKQQDYTNALAAFDAVLEHYSENPKTAGSHYWKGKTLLAMGKRDAAAKEFREILSKYPNSDVAPQAKTELRNLGLSPGTGAANKGGRSRRTPHQ